MNEHSSASSTLRPPSAIDALADRYVDDLIDLNPTLAISLGMPLPDNALPDFSATADMEASHLHRRVLRELQALSETDHTDHLTAASLRHWIGNTLDRIEAGTTVGQVACVDSPFQVIRDAFLLMPTATESDWVDIIRVIEAIPRAYLSLREGVLKAIEVGHPPTAVQRRWVLEDLRTQTTSTNPSAAMLDKFDTAPPPAPSPLRERLQAAVHQATEATCQMRSWLAANTTDEADEDSVGRDLLQLSLERFIGDSIEIEQTYQWALERVLLIDARQREIATALYGEDVCVREALRRLDRDSRYTLVGVDALRQWMQTTADAAIDSLADTHFTVPPQIRRIECMISPSSDGGIFYTEPSDDFTRPGRMWWSVPPKQTEFHTWQEKTTVYHEGMPGHHMQLGIAATRTDLNRWRRHLCWYSGHGEGWALYAESLMEELGLLSDPGEVMGMLDAQRLRAVRVVVDLGLHAKLPLPPRSYFTQLGIDEAAWEQALASSPFPRITGPRTATGWDRHSLWAFLSLNVAMSPAFLRFEATRYLGMPGQASSYAVGQERWLQLRERHFKLHPQSNLKEFHDQALAVGALPLSVLAQAWCNGECDV